MGPGWEPGKPRLGNIEDIPDVSISSVTDGRGTQNQYVGVLI